MMRIAAVVLFLLLLVLAPVGFLVAAMDSFPLIDVAPTAQAGDAARTKGLIKKLRAAVNAETERHQLLVSEGEINSAFSVASRGLPFLRGKAEVRRDAAQLNLTTSIPGLPIKRWLNLAVVIAPSEKRLELVSVRIGRFSLPPRIIIPILGMGLDMAMGDGLGSVAVNSVNRVTLRGRTASFGIAISPEDREAIAAVAKKQLRAASPFGKTEDVRAYYNALEQATANRQLPTRGSFVKHLRFAFDLADKRAPAGQKAVHMRSAVMALAIYCGLRDLESMIGGVVPEGESQNSRSSCRGVTLGGRGDLRQHFIVSAALKMASDSGFALAIGEFKELLDSNRGGSGFSFDDLAADRAGIRFAEVVFGPNMTAASAHKRVRGIVGETSIFPNIKDLPSGLSEAEFKRRFGSADSRAYRKMLAQIEARLDRLTFFQTK